MAIKISVVNMKDGSSAIKLESPYHPELPKRLRALGGPGYGGNGIWYLPSDMGAQVSRICLDIFGVDPLSERPVELVTLRTDAPTHISGNTYWLFGREILARLSRDSQVRPGDGVSIISGGFLSSGGSRNNPKIGWPDDGTVLYIRNVPRALAEKFVSENPEANAQVVEVVPTV